MAKKSDTNTHMKKIETATVISKKEIARGYFVLELESPDIGANSIPGQFVNLKIRESSNEPLLRKPLGIHAASEKGISVLFKVVGKGTRELSLKEPGDKLSVLGPLGNGFDIEPVTGKKCSKVIMVAGGHGMAPLFYLAKELAAKSDVEMEVFIGVKTEEQLICVNEVKDLGARVYIATEDGSCGAQCYITERLRDYLKDNPDAMECSNIYSCGPEPMLAVVAEVMKEFSTRAQVSLDTYMACGIGACLGCATLTVNGYKMVCKDGPVFFSDEIIWRENVC